jgi:hypothetical protein
MLKTVSDPFVWSVWLHPKSRLIRCTRGNSRIGVLLSISHECNRAEGVPLQHVSGLDLVRFMRAQVASYVSIVTGYVLVTTTDLLMVCRQIIAVGSKSRN